jgi:FlaA1/EpsC-like NDP-sugar epimerase
MSTSHDSTLVGVIKRLRQRSPFALQLVPDAITWAGSCLFTAVLAHRIRALGINWLGVALFIGLSTVALIAMGFVRGLYRGRTSYGSFDEVALVTQVVLYSAIIQIVVLLLWTPRPVPMSNVPMASGFGLAAMVGIRYVWRLMVEHATRRDASAPGSVRTVVFGAGEGAMQTLFAMIHDPTNAYVPVALIDDDPAKRNLRVRGIRVQGPRTELAEVARRFNATTLVIAVPSASGQLLAEVRDEAARCNPPLTVKVVPALSNLLADPIKVSSIRDISMEDVLGRRQIETDLASIAQQLAGARVLVTGAGGSIGSELCRQLSRFDLAELMMLDRDESALHAVQLSIEGQALLDSPNTILVDIRDSDALHQIFADRQPDVVFHAAALKHLPLLERFPDEAYKSNVIGTLNVLQAAESVGVSRFINISTDKAADPASVLGASKRIAERLTAEVASTSAQGRYLSVRFGNVLGSRGSVLHTFAEQIAKGGPVTVTDPDVTRYFMTIPEAVQLVLQASVLGSDGEVLILDMGEPVKIVDVARQLIAQSGRSIDVVFTGLRTGEKLHEDLLGTAELDIRPHHPLISHSPVPPLSTDTIGHLDAVTAETLLDLCDRDIAPMKVGP